MKTNIFWLLVMLFAFADAIAQTPSLLLVNKESGVTRTIAEGRKVGVTTRYGKYVSGPMTIINDSIVQVDQTPYSLGEILSIRAKTRQAPTTGAVLASAGTAMMVVGIVLVLGSDESDSPLSAWEQENQREAGGVVASAGAAIAATGIVIMLSPRTFSSAEWKFYIER